MEEVVTSAKRQQGEGGTFISREGEAMSWFGRKQRGHTCVLLAGTFFTPLAFAGTSLPLLASTEKSYGSKVSHQHLHSLTASV